MRIGDKNKETAITVLEAFKIAIRKTGQINVRKENEEETIEYIDMAIEALKSQSKIGEWIPCSERLPENISTVIVQVKEIKKPTFGWYKDLEKKWILSEKDFVDLENFSVIAWQPLPEEYRIQDSQSEEQEMVRASGRR